jgi:PKD repeat protein
VRLRVRTNKVPTGGNAFAYAAVRRVGNNEYRPRVTLHANGTVSAGASVVINGTESAVGTAVVVPGLTQSANSFILLRAEVTGANPTTIRVKAWANGQPEPAGWHYTATNTAAAVQTAGSLGIRTLLGSPVSNAPITFGFDDYQVSGPSTEAPTANFSWAQQAGTLQVSFTDTSTGSPTSWSWNFGDGTSSTQQNPTKTYAAAGTYNVTLTATNSGGSNPRTHTVTVSPVGSGTEIAADAFGRTVSNGWGSADTGGAYTLEGSSANFAVGGGTGNLTLPAAGANRAATLGGLAATNVDVRFRVSVDKLATGNSFYAYAVVRRDGTNAYRPKIILHANGTVSAHAGVVVNGTESSVAPPVLVSGLSQSPGSFIWVRTQVQGTNPTTIRVKAWAEGQAEPSTWHFTATNSTAAVQTAGSVGLRAYIGTTVSNAPVVFRFDDFEVVTLP